MGGVTHTVSMDNAKALVTKPGLIPILTENIRAFGDHFDVLMDTCRVAKGQDKSLVELGVKGISQHILVPVLLDQTFFSLEEINQFLSKEVEKLNEKPFQGMDISRNDLFNRNEKVALKPLPNVPFKMIVARLKQQVPPNYHVRYQKHDYSVPYAIHGKSVDIVVDQSNLRVLHEHKEVACHAVNNQPMGATTLSEHMPAEHLADIKNNDKDINLSWARKSGNSVEKIVSGWYEKTANPKSRAIGKRCQALRKLSDKHGIDVLNDACEYANLHGMSTPADISLIISAYNHSEGFDSLPMFNLAHQNVRGAEYYGGRHEA